MKATVYDTFDPTPFRTHRRALEFLRPGERVLEVGCSSGALTERVRALGCTVVGIERRPEAAEKAAPHCERVLVGDVEKMAVDLPPASFDVLLLLDVLEHLADPRAAVVRLLPFLRPGGRILVALPNVAHWSVRFRLLLGRFEYGDSGILDRTHRHFFTLKSARAFLESAGLRVVQEDLVPDVPFLRYKPGLAAMNYRVAHLVPGLFATEGLFVAQPTGTPSSP